MFPENVLYMINVVNKDVGLVLVMRSICNFLVLYHLFMVEWSVLTEI